MVWSIKILHISGKTKGITIVKHESNSIPLSQLNKDYTLFLTKLLLSIFLTVFSSYTLKPQRPQHIREVRDQSHSD